MVRARCPNSSDPTVSLLLESAGLMLMMTRRRAFVPKALCNATKRSGEVCPCTSAKRSPCARATCSTRVSLESRHGMKIDFPRLCDALRTEQLVMHKVGTPHHTIIQHTCFALTAPTRRFPAQLEIC